MNQYYILTDATIIDCLDLWMQQPNTDTFT